MYLTISYLTISYLTILSIILVFYFIYSKETFVDYDYIKSTKYNIYDKILEEKKNIFLLKKDKVVDDIKNKNKSIKDIRSKGDYLPTNNYPFYDGGAFFESIPGQKVMTGIPSLYSGGNLKSPIKKYKPFEIANYNPGISRTSSNIPSSANF